MKVRTTLTIDEDVLRAIRVKAARTGMSCSAAIESAVRRDIEWDVLDRLWERASLPPDEAMGLALDAQHEARRQI